MKKILPFFSYLFHPIFIPLLGTVLYILFQENYFTIPQVYLLIFQVIIITIFLPMSFFYLLKTFGKVDTIMLSDVNQRKIPLLLQMALTVVLIKQSITIDRFPELHYFFLAGLITTFIAFVLLFFKIKSSIHMIGVSALTFFVIGLSLHNQINIIYLIALLFLFTGVIASSRLYMKAHTMTELIIGYAIGMIPQLIVWYAWL
ncbi:hypothetical protein [Flavobacterium sp.]|uniref:hypothetical protein n=1 Tax=Flavobacterium sp. TaxID=239 RepID=UPI002B4B0EF1|nr:hypothetical protein [Flavobacterium sp.]HLP63492.1 hypothetical protein [Flavobacterium sp.]